MAGGSSKKPACFTRYQKIKDDLDRERQVLFLEEINCIKNIIIHDILRDKPKRMQKQARAKAFHCVLYFFLKVFLRNDKIPIFFADFMV